MANAQPQSYAHFLFDTSASYLQAPSNVPGSHSSLGGSFSPPSETLAAATTDPASSLSIYLKIIIGSFLVLVILVSIFGNLLICIAIYSDRRLRKLGNLFIVSLGMYDFGCVESLDDKTHS